MTNSSDPNKALTNYLRTLSDSMKKLEGINMFFSSKADVEPDEFKRTVYDRLAQYPKVMNELYMNIKMLAIAKVSLQVKLEGLRDIVYELEEVKKSPAIQEKIRKLFLDYESRF